MNSSAAINEPALSQKTGHDFDRSTAPVFVVGCHRSGTNLLYDTLLSAGGFTIYRGYLPIYKTLIPRFGGLEKSSNRRRLIETWLRSKGFRRSGLQMAELKTRLVQECRTGGDFIRIVMDEVAQQQKVNRWAVYDPDNVLYIPKIKADIPNALFVHMVRDGRDIALSLKKMGGFRPLPWRRKQSSLLGTGLYWQWMVNKGRQYGRSIPSDYLEIRYEDLVLEPHRTLKQLSAFLVHNLDYDRIQQQGLGRLRDSNSSFRDEAQAGQGDTQPVNRWKERLSPEQVGQLESLVGETLKELGYELSTGNLAKPASLNNFVRRAMYPMILNTKFWLKGSTPLGRFAGLSELELSADHA